MNFSSFKYNKIYIIFLSDLKKLLFLLCHIQIKKYIYMWKLFYGKENQKTIEFILNQHSFIFPNELMLMLYEFQYLQVQRLKIYI